MATVVEHIDRWQSSLRPQKDHILQTTKKPTRAHY